MAYNWLLGIYVDPNSTTFLISLLAGIAFILFLYLLGSIVHTVRRKYSDYLPESIFIGIPILLTIFAISTFSHPFTTTDNCIPVTPYSMKFKEVIKDNAKEVCVYYNDSTFCEGELHNMSLKCYNRDDPKFDNFKKWKDITLVKN